MAKSKNILNSYIPKFLVDLNRENDDVITVTTNYFSPNGDSYILDTRTISPVLIQTTQSLQELKPEISNTYPYRVVMPVDVDGASLLISPSISTEPTASQSYYAPIYFERYNASILSSLDKTFYELVTTE